MGSAANRRVPDNVLCYGEARRLPRPIPLRAGPIRLVLEDGTLRSLFVGRCEVLKQAYVAIRDANWVTIPGEISGLRVERQRHSFRVRYRSTHRRGPIHFVWDADLSGSDDGVIRFRMKGVARSTFLRARIGLCLLHASEACAGLSCEVLRGGVDAPESTDQVAFGREIVPGCPAPGFEALRGISYEAALGLHVRIRLDGDLFETEDQRNWTDASFKTFSTPVHLPIPVEVRKGTRVEQSFTLAVTGVVPARTEPGRGRRVTLRLGRKRIGKLPALGLGAASDGQGLSEQELARLTRLRLAHLRVDLDFRDNGWQRNGGQTLSGAARDARAMRVPLEIALIGAEGGLPPDFVSAVRGCGVKVARWLLYPDSAVLSDSLRREFPGSVLAAGTNANFISFNEAPPRAGYLDQAAFAVHPQTHATDRLSLVETLAIQGELVDQARRLTGLPVVVSPVTLKPRFNPDATGPEPPTPVGELPPAVDVRQMSLFGAGWTLGSIKYLAEAGAASVTYYETAGWRGVMERASGSPLPPLFRSVAGQVFPIYCVLAWLAEFRGAALLSLESDAPLSVAGLALRQRGQARALVANLTDSSQTVLWEGLPKRARVQVLDESNTRSLFSNPVRFLNARGKLRRLDEFVLPRFSLARLDWEASDGR